MSKPLTIREFFKRFPTDEDCLKHVWRVRFGKLKECPKCGKPASFHPLSKRPAYSCQHCAHHIYPCAGTPFERTRTPLQLWFYAIYLFTTTRHGVSAKELQRQLGVTYKTAWRMGHEIRKHMGKIDGDDGLSGHVETDETFVGGKPRGKPVRRGKHRPHKKTVVVGMVERGGNLMTHVVPAAKKHMVFPLINRHIAKGSRISTDESRLYIRLRDEGFKHTKVNHSQGQYVDGDTHVNTLEGFWAHFKNSVIGTHRAISPKHMAKYLGEFEFRFNLRSAPGQMMFDRLIQSF